MSGLPWFRCQPRRFLEGMIGLTREERGVFSTLMMLRADLGHPIRYEDWRIAPEVGATIRVWQKLKASLVRKGAISLTDLGLDLPIFSDVFLLRKTKRPPLSEWNRLRELVIRRDGKLCRYCGAKSGKFELDHVHPISKGGGNEPENLALACFPCNRSKGAKFIHEWSGATI